MTIVLYIVVGLVVGVISGMLGIGGGVLLVPAFIWIFGFEHTTATGTTLAILVPPIGLLAALEYYRRGAMNLEAAGIVALTFVVGAYGGARIVPHVPVPVLRLLFGLMLIFVAFRFILSASAEAASAFFGLIAVALAWLAFLWLRLIGHRHVVRPRLRDKIRALQQPEQSASDYYI